jgi:hypothetical protein
MKTSSARTLGQVSEHPRQAAARSPLFVVVSRTFSGAMKHEIWEAPDHAAVLAEASGQRLDTRFVMDAKHFAAMTQATMRSTLEAVRETDPVRRNLPDREIVEQGTLYLVFIANDTQAETGHYETGAFEARTGEYDAAVARLKDSGIANPVVIPLMLAVDLMGHAYLIEDEKSDPHHRIDSHAVSHGLTH